MADVPRLREIRAEPYYYGPDEAELVWQRLDRVLDALLADAPPDGAAEREDRSGLVRRIAESVERMTHFSKDDMVMPMSRAGFRVRIVEAIGQTIEALDPLPTPAPTEAPAAGDGGEGFTDAAFAAYNRWVSTQEMAPSGYPAFFAGAEWAAALARPAAVTDEMVEAFCLSFHGERWLKWLEEIKAQYRADAGVHLTAALAARGPA